MNNIKQEFEREALVLGDDAVIKLNNSSVALFGVGGVGSYAAEALARAGVGRIMLIDNDTVSRSNINRQLCALQSTIGQFKVDVVAKRIRDINPDATVECRRDFVLPDNIDTFSLEDFDFVIDAIDTVSAKIAIIERSLAVGTPSVSCMGTGNIGIADQVGVQGFENGLAGKDFRSHRGAVGHTGAAEGFDQRFLDHAVFDVQREFAASLLRSAPADTVGQT